MGYWKERQVWEGDLGFSAPAGSAVCAECVADSALKAFVESRAANPRCDFCEREGDADVAADTDDVLEHISLSLRREWSTPLEAGLIWDQEDYGWIGGAVYELRDVLDDGEWPFANADFEEFVLRAFAETEWCARDPGGLDEGEALHFSWDLFRETVMHETRFLFALRDYDTSHDDPGHPLRRGGKMLEELGRLIAHYDLVTTLTPEETLYRVRIDDVEKVHSTASSLGAPEAEKARQSRMSPAGIPMLYAATDLETAEAETLDPQRVEGKALSRGSFRTREAVSIVDLTSLPSVPSVFSEDEEALASRPSLGFLHGFCRDVSRPIDRDDRVHVEYVPTQVVCEYIRFLFPRLAGKEIAGLTFESARRDDGRNVVLFVDQAHCLEPGEQPPLLEGPVVELVDSDRRELGAAAAVS